MADSERSSDNPTVAKRPVALKRDGRLVPVSKDVT